MRSKLWRKLLCDFLAIFFRGVLFLELILPLCFLERVRHCCLFGKTGFCSNFTHKDQRSHPWIFFLQVCFFSEKLFNEPATETTFDKDREIRLGNGVRCSCVKNSKTANYDRVYCWKKILNSCKIFVSKRLEWPAIIPNHEPSKSNNFLLTK